MRTWSAEAESEAQEKKMLNGLESLLTIVGLEVMSESVWTVAYSKSWRERVPAFRSCNAETAGAK